MAPTVYATLVILSCFLFCSSVVSAFNITKLLERYPDYSTFNQILSQTNVAEEVNKRRTITVLAIANGAMSGITSQPIESVKNIMRDHVILDYYDNEKLRHLKKGNSQLTTLFQTTGVASHQQGFIIVSSVNGDIKFGSAVPGAPLDSKLVKAVASQPFNISVLEISTPIITPGLNGAPIAPVTAPPPKKAAPPKQILAEAPSDDEPAIEAPTPAEAEELAPSDAPVNAPANSPSPSEADKAADEDNSPPLSSYSSRNSFVSGAILLASLVATM